MTLNVDLRSCFPPVRDQGPRGTCLAFAVTGTHEYSRAACSQTIKDLSTETLYWRSRQLLKGVGIPSGLTFDSVADALDGYGQPEDAKWPYSETIDEGATTYFPPKDAVKPSNCFKAKLEHIDVTVSAVVAALDSNTAVVAGIYMCYPFEDTDGIIHMPKPSEVISDGHAIVFVGYARDAVNNQVTYLLFRNSWGDEWGDEGYGYLPVTYFQNYCFAARMLHPR